MDESVHICTLCKFDAKAGDPKEQSRIPRFSFDLACFHGLAGFLVGGRRCGRKSPSSALFNAVRALLRIGKDSGAIGSATLPSRALVPEFVALDLAGSGF